MPAVDYVFRCMRCGHEYTGPYNKKNQVERMCRKCKSNSIRPVRPRPFRRNGQA